jgi:hypothetical protein
MIQQDDTADGTAGSSLIHHKFVIVDISDTSGYLSNSSSLGNANNLLNIYSLELATLFTEEFNNMWGDGAGGKPNSKFGLKKSLHCHLINYTF